MWDKRCEEKYKDDYGDGELAWTSFNRPIRIFHYLWKGFLQHNMKQKEKRIHPTQKPVALMEWILLNYSKPDDLILDPFMGTGSTLIAANRLNRQAIGIEIVKDYCDKAIDRLKQLELPLNRTVSARKITYTQETITFKKNSQNGH